MKSTRDAKPGGIRSRAEGTERRRDEMATVATEHKEHALQKKRLRREASAASLGGLGNAVAEEDLVYTENISTPAPETPSDITQKVRAAVEAVNTAKPVGGKGHLDAVRALRQLLSNYEEPPYAAALAAGAVPALIAALQPPRMDSTALEALFEAAWALSNLAVGDAQVVRAVLPAAPILIAYVSGGSGFAVAEQCAWALGNIAGEDAEYRGILVANGAVRPLAELVSQGARASAAGNANANPAVSAGGTAAWALANLLRGAGHEVGELMSTPGAPEGLIQAISKAPDGFTTEVGWVLAYATTGHEAHLNRLVALGLLPPLTARMEGAVQAVLQGGDEGNARALLTPLLRTLGNVAAGGGSAAMQTLLAPESAGALKAVVICAESGHHGLQREAAWVLSSIAGFPGKAGVDALRSAGALPVLMYLLKEQPFQVRREAAFALANVVAGGGGGSGDAEAMNFLFGGDVDAVRAMVSLLRAADSDAALLGLQFTEMLLRLLPSGVREVEAVDGIDALEAVQFGAGDAEVGAAAAALVDRYWGQDADMNETEVQ